MAKKGNRIQVILECTEHKNSGLPGTSRYVTTKNKKNTPDRMELKKYNHIIFFLWGTWLIVSLLFFNSIELEEIANQSTAFSINKKTLSILPPLFYLLSISLFVVLVSLSAKKILKVNHFFQEIFTLILLALTFHIFPFVVGFTMYFVFLHSIRVLYQEYDFLKSRIKKLSYTSL